MLDGVTIKVVRFDSGSDDLTDQAKWELRSILPSLRGSPQKIMVRGYTAPSEGAGAFSKESDLAFSRAISVMDYLVSLDTNSLNPDYFELSVAPATVPTRNTLPAGTDPSLAGASVEILLLNQTMRQLRQ
jgi:hypothetical protein